MKRLIKKSYTPPNAGILVKDIDSKIENDDISKITYNSTIDRTWQFEKDIDNSEWSLQQ